jgi:hypothetical protein
MPNTADWLKRLKEGFASRYPGKKHQIKLPSGISFVTQNDGVRVVLSREAVEDGNMQSDAAAFEAWALALHGYAGAKFVELRWTGAPASRHAWRFRLRALQFAHYFGAWFRLGGELAGAFEAGITYVLNVESEPRTGAVKPFATSLKERELEDVIVRDSATSGRFKEAFGLQVLGQQLPVGVFNQTVSKANGISPRGSAAIDIWGIQGETLHLFELKKFPGKSGKKPLGIISELFLYVSLMRAVQKKHLTFGPGPKDAPYLKIADTKRIEAWLLAPLHHPLIEYGDAPMLELLNLGFKSAQEPISFQRAHIGKDCTFSKA